MFCRAGRVIPPRQPSGPHISIIRLRQPSKILVNFLVEGRVTFAGTFPGCFPAVGRLGLGAAASRGSIVELSNYPVKNIQALRNFQTENREISDWVLT